MPSGVALAAMVNADVMMVLASEMYTVYKKAAPPHIANAPAADSGESRSGTQHILHDHAIGADLD